MPQLQKSDVSDKGRRSFTMACASRSRAPPVTMQDMNDECLCMIFNSLALQDKLQLMPVCKRICSLLSRPSPALSWGNITLDLSSKAFVGTCEAGMSRALLR